MQKCVFCNTTHIKVIQIPEKDSMKVECPLCIRYIISDTAIQDSIISKIPDEDKILFSAHLRKNALAGSSLRLISDDVIKIPEIVVILFS